MNLNYDITKKLRIKNYPHIHYMRIKNYLHIHYMWIKNYPHIHYMRIKNYPHIHYMWINPTFNYRSFDAASVDTFMSDKYIHHFYELIAAVYQYFPPVWLVGSGPRSRTRWQWWASSCSQAWPSSSSTGRTGCPPGWGGTDTITGYTNAQ